MLVPFYVQSCLVSLVLSSHSRPHLVLCFKFIKDPYYTYQLLFWSAFWAAISIIRNTWQNDLTFNMDPATRTREDQVIGYLLFKLKTVVEENPDPKAKMAAWSKMEEVMLSQPSLGEIPGTSELIDDTAHFRQEFSRLMDKIKTNPHF